MTTHAIKNSEDIKSLGTILSVWAHPDDETFTCGGIIATAAANGQHVACVTMTKGEAGSQDTKRWPLETLGAVRAKELHDALTILGCNHHHILDYPDGGLAASSRTDATNLIKDLVRKYQPDTILTFGPEGMTGHSDHQTISAWVNQAVGQLKQPPSVYHAVEWRVSYEKYMKDLDKQFDIYFNIDEPPLRDQDECDIFYKLPKDICDKKCAALAAMPSQTAGLMNHLGDKARDVFSHEVFEKAC